MVVAKASQCLRRRSYEAVLIKVQRVCFPNLLVHHVLRLTGYVGAVGHLAVAAIAGDEVLRRGGGPAGGQRDPPAGGNKGAGLMASGIYGVVGYLMRLGARLLMCAMFCWMPTGLMRLLAFVKVGAIEGWADREQGENGAKFKQDYVRYKEKCRSKTRSWAWRGGSGREGRGIRWLAWA